MVTVLKTKRLIIEPLETDRDEAFVLQLLNEPGFLENIGDRGVRDLEGARGYIVNGPLASYETNGFGLWRVAALETGQPLGICGLVRRDGLDHPDIGYAFLSRHWGQGFAEEAARGCIDYGREALGLGTVVAVTTLTNFASMRVLEKVGLRRSGTVRLPGREDDSAYFIQEA